MKKSQAEQVPYTHLLAFKEFCLYSKLSKSS